MIASVNPYTRTTLKTFEPLSGAELNRRVQLARDAFESHRKTSFAERAAKLLQAAQILESEARQFGALMTAEMGKTIAAAEAEAKSAHSRAGTMLSAAPKRSRMSVSRLKPPEPSSVTNRSGQCSR
jgi:acyl-CoA reductase-like NAD-dependent aldehyde dehydrogenase